MWEKEIKKLCVREGKKQIFRDGKRQKFLAKKVIGRERKRER